MNIAWFFETGVRRKKAALGTMYLMLSNVYSNIKNYVTIILRKLFINHYRHMNSYGETKSMNYSYYALQTNNIFIYAFIIMLIIF